MVFLDACIVIYLVEAAEPFHAQVLDTLQPYASEGFAVSCLSLLECCVKPLRDGDQALLQRYETFFQAREVRLIELDQAVVRAAARLRARHGIATPDALQAASALRVASQPRFITGDKNFQRLPELEVILV